MMGASSTETYTAFEVQLIERLTRIETTQTVMLNRLDQHQQKLDSADQYITAQRGSLRAMLAVASAAALVIPPSVQALWAFLLSLIHHQ